MLRTQEARRFAESWVRAWNAHDLDLILDHYTDDFVMTTPFIAKVMNEPTGSLKGKVAVRAYWTQALECVPDLHFELTDVLTGVNSLTICYKAVFGKRGAEVFFFNDVGKVCESVAHYNEL